MSPPSRDMFSYVGIRMSSVALPWDRSRGSTYGLTSLEGEGLPVRPTVRTQSYRRTHLLLQGLVPPLLQRLASRDLPVVKGLAPGEAPVPEGLVVHEVPPVLEPPLVPDVPKAAG